MRECYTVDLSCYLEYKTILNQPELRNYRKISEVVRRYVHCSVTIINFAHFFKTISSLLYNTFYGP